MTLLELKEYIDHALNQIGNEDAEVCIPNNKNTMGGVSVTHVKHSHMGIDWDSNKFILYPEVKMVEQDES